MDELIKMIEPTKVWTKEEWESMDFRDLPESPFRTLLKHEAFMKMYNYVGTRSDG